MAKKVNGIMSARRISNPRLKAARKSWQERAELWRDKIAVSNIITALDKHVSGELEMSPTQVKAAQVLLDRVMPTLSASEIRHKIEPVSPEQLIAMLRERYGDEFAARISSDYLPRALPAAAEVVKEEDVKAENEPIHEPGHA